MIPEHGHDRDAFDEWPHVREEVIRPVPFVASGGDEIADVHQQARPRLECEIGDSLHDRGLRLGVADRHEGERIAAIGGGTEGLHAAGKRRLSGVGDHFVEVLGVRIETVDTELVDPSGLLVPPGPLKITRLIPDPNLHRRRRDGLGHHAHRIGRRPDEEWFHHPREGGVDLRRKRGKIRVPGESASHFGRGDRLGQDRDFKEATVEAVIFVPVDIAANHQRFVASKPDRPRLVATFGDRLTIDVEPHRRAVIGTDKMVPLADLIGL